MQVVSYLHTCTLAFATGKLLKWYKLVQERCINWQPRYDWNCVESGVKPNRKKKPAEVNAKGCEHCCILSFYCSWTDSIQSSLVCAVFVYHTFKVFSYSQSINHLNACHSMPLMIIGIYSKFWNAVDTTFPSNLNSSVGLDKKIF